MLVQFDVKFCVLPGIFKSLDVTEMKEQDLTDNRNSLK
jgi:hypothetical protein